MSTHDESWDRPICRFCNNLIRYGEICCHADGACLTRWKFYLDLHNEMAAEKRNRDAGKISKKSRELNLATKHMMTTGQTIANYDCAALEIISLIERLGFTTNIPVDPKRLKLEISSIILSNIEGNTNYNEQTS